MSHKSPPNRRRGKPPPGAKDRPPTTDSNDSDPDKEFKTDDRYKSGRYLDYLDEVIRGRKGAQISKEQLEDEEYLKREDKEGQFRDFIGENTEG